MSVEDVKLSNTERVKCSSCGADMTFNPEKQTLTCEHCGFVLEIEYGFSEEKDFFAGCNEIEWDGEAITYRCENCSAITTLQKGEIAGHCPFCGAPKVIAVEEQKGVKPNAIIPFAIDKEGAKQHYKQWIKKRLFAPSKVKKNFSADSIKGVYIPCWTYDSKTHSVYEGRLGEYYYVTVGSGKNRRTEQRIRWFRVYGEYDLGFDDVAVEASEKIDQKRFGQIGPFPTGEAYAFDTKYMSGFTAERYSLGLKEGFEIARGRMDAIIRRNIIAKYHADIVDYLNVRTQYNNLTYKYVLLPIWLCSFVYGKKKKSYGFAVNGKTGKTAGKTPISFWRVLIAVLLGIGVVGLFVFLALNA